MSQNILILDCYASSLNSESKRMRLRIDQESSPVQKLASNWHEADIIIQVETEAGIVLSTCAVPIPMEIGAVQVKRP